MHNYMYKDRHMHTKIPVLIWEGVNKYLYIPSYRKSFSAIFLLCSCKSTVAIPVRGSLAKNLSAN